METPETVETLLQTVVKQAKSSRGLICGAHQTAKALESQKALLCVLANNCAEPQYIKLIEGLCQEHNIQMLRIESNKKLGEIVGHCKFDKDMNPRKTVSCSVAVITNLPSHCPMWEQLLEVAKAQ